MAVNDLVRPEKTQVCKVTTNFLYCTVQRYILTHTNVSQQQRYLRFVDSDLSTGPLVQDVVPGLGEVSVDKLKAKGIDTVSKLVGQFFLHDRSKEEFVTYLQGCGVTRTNATSAAFALEDKLNVL